MLDIVYFGGDQDDRFTLASQPLGNLLVGGGELLPPVHEKKDDGRLGEGDFRLFADLFLPLVAAPQAAGINELQPAVLEEKGLFLHVAGHARLVSNNGRTTPDKTIEQAGLADIRPSDDHDLLHGCAFQGAVSRRISAV